MQLTSSLGIFIGLNFLFICNSLFMTGPNNWTKVQIALPFLVFNVHYMQGSHISNLWMAMLTLLT